MLTLLPALRASSRNSKWLSLFYPLSHQFVYMNSRSSTENNKTKNLKKQNSFKICSTSRTIEIIDFCSLSDYLQMSNQQDDKIIYASMHPITEPWKGQTHPQLQPKTSTSIPLKLTRQTEHQQGQRIQKVNLSANDLIDISRTLHTTLEYTVSLSTEYFPI